MTSIKERLRTGKEPLAGFVNIIPSPVATQALASAGADMLMIDQEHGPIGPESLHAMIASTAGTGCSPWVRVSRRDEASVKTALDAGAEGIVFPLVTTAESAADCVALTRYPPQGPGELHRSGDRRAPAQARGGRHRGGPPGPPEAHLQHLQEDGAQGR